MPHNPLLVSVRSGARASMPGMMDTVLNLGLNDETVQGIIAQSGDARFAYDAYRRFVQMYSDVVMGMDKDDPRAPAGADEGAARGPARHRADRRRSGRNWSPCSSTRSRESLGQAFPDDPQEQLWGAIGAVFGSWMNQRAITYRRLNNIPADWGTAVNVQSMVFGNMGDDCATGVAFTRDPSTGENYFYGEYPGQRPGRGRGRRHPHPAADQQGQAQAGRPAGHGRGAARVLRPAGEDPRHPGEALQGHAGHRVHHRDSASSTCCRPATASAPPRRRSRSPSTWSRKG